MPGCPGSPVRRAPVRLRLPAHLEHRSSSRGARVRAWERGRLARFGQARPRAGGRAGRAPRRWPRQYLTDVLGRIGSGRGAGGGSPRSPVLGAVLSDRGTSGASERGDEPPAYYLEAERRTTEVVATNDL